VSIKVLANISINIGELLNMRTITGRKELPFNSYLYDKRRIMRETMDDGSGRHMVYCWHCCHNWGPYISKNDTLRPVRPVRLTPGTSE